MIVIFGPTIIAVAKVLYPLLNYDPALFFFKVDKITYGLEFISGNHQKVNYPHYYNNN